MYVVLAVSVLAWGGAIAWSLRIRRRIGDWRIWSLPAVISLLAVTDVASALSGGTARPSFPGVNPHELSNLIVSLATFAGVVLADRMVAQRRGAVASLARSEERFRTICENAPVLIDSFDEQGRCWLWNRACEQTLGWTQGEMIAAEDPLALCYPDPAERDRVASNIGRADGVFRECRVHTKEGATRIQLWADFKLPDETRIAVGYDITERKEAEDALRAAREQLEQRVAERTHELRETNDELRHEIAERLEAEQRALEHQARLAHVLRVNTMGQMVAAIAHEINQPLGALVNWAGGCAARVRAGAVTMDDVAGILDRIEAEGLRAGDVVRRIREFMAGSREQRSVVDVGEIVASAVALIERADPRFARTIRVQTAPGLPPVHADPIQIEQVVLNLLRNARDATASTDAKDAEIVVETTADAAGHVGVSVRDHGEGLPADRAAHLFEPFFTTRSTGLGMGLAISKDIIDSHGGQIAAEANPEGGATFRFTLPPASEANA
jgi:PAS domain S-box-containing protein